MNDKLAEQVVAPCANVEVYPLFRLCRVQTYLIEMGSWEVRT